MGTDFLIHKITMQVGTMSVTPQMQKQPIWMNNTSQSCEIAEFFDIEKLCFLGNCVILILS